MPNAVQELVRRRCTACGEVHEPHPLPGRPNTAWSWAAEDGHPYRPESWEAVAYRLADLIAKGPEG